MWNGHFKLNIMFAIICDKIVMHKHAEQKSSTGRNTFIDNFNWKKLIMFTETDTDVMERIHFRYRHGIKCSKRKGSQTIL